MSNYRLRSRHATTRSRRRSILQTLPFVMVGAVAAHVALFYPQKYFQKPSSKLNERVFAEGLKIELDRTSPAFAAMEDVLLGKSLTEFESLASLNRPGQVELLEAGAVAGQTLANMIIRDNHREEALMAQARASREASARLMAQAAAEAFERMAAAFAAKKPIPSNAKPTATAPQARTEPPKIADHSREKHSAGKALPPADFTHPTKTIRLSDLRMTRDQLAKELLMPLATADVGDGPSLETMVAGGSSYRTITSRRILPQPKLGGLGARPQGALPTYGRGISQPNFENASSRPTQDPTTQKKDESAKAFGTLNEPLHQLVIGGPIEFANGLALTNATDRVIVYRENEGQMMESGAVWLKEGRYEIFVETAEGSLLAELRTPHGDILGRGLFDLADLPATPNQQYKVDSVALRIQPVPQGFVGHVLSANSYDGKKIPVSGAQVGFEDLPFQAVSFKDGRFEEPNLLEGSMALLKTTRAGHWNTLLFGTSGMENTVPLFPDKMMAAFTSIVSPTAMTDKNSVIWGKVIRGGAPVAGARVELLTVNEVVRPVYFNEMMIPDLSMDATGANGLYAFYPVEPGTHAIQATLGQSVSEPVLFPTEAHSVSAADIDMQARQKATIKVFDAFRTDWPLAAEIVQPGVAKGLEIQRNGEGILRFSPGSNLLILDADAGNGYEPVRVSFPRDRRFIYMPMVQTSWLTGVRGAQRVNPQPRSGTIVGFIQGTAPYQVSMDQRGLTSESRVVYFNSRGQVTDQDFGQPGGGFILFNVSDGYRSVVIQPKGMTKTFATTVLVESKVTNIINHWIR